MDNILGSYVATVLIVDDVVYFGGNFYQAGQLPAQNIVGCGAQNGSCFNNFDVGTTHQIDSMLYNVNDNSLYPQHVLFAYRSLLHGC